MLAQLFLLEHVLNLRSHCVDTGKSLSSAAPPHTPTHAECYILYSSAKRGSYAACCTVHMQQGNLSSAHKGKLSAVDKDLRAKTSCH